MCEKYGGWTVPLVHLYLSCMCVSGGRVINLLGLKERNRELTLYATVFHQVKKEASIYVKYVWVNRRK